MRNKYRDIELIRVYNYSLLQKKNINTNKLYYLIRKDDLTIKIRKDLNQIMKFFKEYTKEYLVLLK